MHSEVFSFLLVYSSSELSFACTTSTVAASEEMTLVKNRSGQELGGFRSRSGRVLRLTTALGVWTCELLDSPGSVGKAMGGGARPYIFVGSGVAAYSCRLWGLTDSS